MVEHCPAVIVHLVLITGTVADHSTIIIREKGMDNDCEVELGGPCL